MSPLRSKVFWVVTLVHLVTISAQNVPRDRLIQEKLLKPGDACDEEKGRAEYIKLIDGKDDILTLASIPKEAWEDLSQYFCDNTTRLEISCQHGKCECTNPTLVWDFKVYKCLKKFGQYCKSGEECHGQLICSDSQGPEQIRRDEEYRWEEGAECMRSCIHEGCGKINSACAENPAECKEVNECRADPFHPVVFVCIGQCHTCVNHPDHDFCQKQCQKDFDGYFANIRTRECNKRCRKEQNSQTCYNDCYRFLISESRDIIRGNLEACPRTPDQSSCVACVNNALKESKLTSRIQNNCASSCGTDSAHCRDKCKVYCIETISSLLDLKSDASCSGTGTGLDVDPFCRVEKFIDILKTVNIVASCESGCNNLPNSSICDSCAKECRTQTEVEFRFGGGKSSNPELSQCNCEAKKYHCKLCESVAEQEFGEANQFYCRSGTEVECGSNCEPLCQFLNTKTHEMACFVHQLNTTNRYSAMIDCMKDPVQLQNINTNCQTLCSSSSTTTGGGTNCTICEAMVNKVGNDSSNLLCTKKDLCVDTTAHKFCEDAAFTTCIRHCNPIQGQGRDVPWDNSCHDRCMDICDLTMKALKKEGVNLARANLHQCRVYCDPGSSTAKCIAPCTRFCTDTRRKENEVLLKCRIPLDPNSPVRDSVKIDYDLITKPNKAKIDHCKNCRREADEKNYDNCKNLCKASTAADKDGSICFRKCVDGCSAGLWFKEQQACLYQCKDPTTWRSRGKACEDQCLKSNGKRHDEITEECFQECLRIPSDEDKDKEYMCFGQDHCVTTCGQKFEDKITKGCFEVLQPAGCRKVNLDVLSTPKDDPCPNCNVGLRAGAIAQCRGFCTLPVTYITVAGSKENNERNLFCKDACERGCRDKLFLKISLQCRSNCDPAGADYGTCLVDCIDTGTKGKYPSCGTKCDVAVELEPTDSATHCPKCLSQCHETDYFEDIAQLKCCGPEEVPDTCAVCNQIMELDCNNTCTNPAGLCLRGKCQDYCIDDRHCKFQVETEFHHSQFLYGECRKQLGQTKTRGNITISSLCKAGSCNPTECPTKCPAHCQNVKKKQDTCHLACGKVNSLGLIEFRRREDEDTDLVYRPTRKPKTRVKQFWCCRNNGRGQCNSPNPHWLKKFNCVPLLAHGFWICPNLLIVVISAFILRSTQ